MRFTTSFRLGTFFRTRIRIHYSWLIVFVLIPWSVSTQFSTETILTTRVLIGLITALLFLFAVFLREIALLILANTKGIEVNTVTIFVFGGLIQTDSETTSPSLEMLLAVSGMLVNFGITAIFYFSSLFIDESMYYMMDIPLKWLAFFYLTLSLFHIVPAYPLEGGRMMHVLFWKLTNNLRLASRISGISGWIMGFLVMAGGVLLAAFTTELFTGLFFVGLGLIIQNAATHSIRDIKLIPVAPEPEKARLSPKAGLVEEKPELDIFDVDFIVEDSVEPGEEEPADL